MSIVKAYDVSYVRFRAPDLDVMKTFLDDFGLLQAHRTETSLSMRGHGTNPVVHITDLGNPGFAGAGIELVSEQDLKNLAQAEGVPVKSLETPGGGYGISLLDPDGFVIEAVWGQEKVAPLALPENLAMNEGGQIARKSKVKRIAQGPSHVLRLGHIVFGVSNFRKSEAWYKERFGFVTSDEIQPAPGVGIGAFMRCDRGEVPCDHHTIFLLERPGAPAGFMHAAFEVANFDDLMAGHAHLKSKQAKSVWGVGRHVLGSQVFDYWNDPWGHEIEHWTDGDQMITADGGGIGSLEELLGVQWGMPMPPMHAGPPPKA